MDTPLEQLSDGYKRRVALAAQLARQPSLLLLDEPLAGVDWPTRASLASLLGESDTRVHSCPYSGHNDASCPQQKCHCILDVLV